MKRKKPNSNNTVYGNHYDIQNIAHLCNISTMAIAIIYHFNNIFQLSFFSHSVCSFAFASHSLWLRNNFHIIPSCVSEYTISLVVVVECFSRRWCDVDIYSNFQMRKSFRINGNDEVFPNNISVVPFVHTHPVGELC